MKEWDVKSEEKYFDESSNHDNTTNFCSEDLVVGYKRRGWDSMDAMRAKRKGQSR